MKYYIKTFGCQQNKADSERISLAFMARGFQEAAEYEDADYAIINTCMVRRSAEDRVYGLVRNLAELKKKKKFFKIIVTGCMVGLAFRDATGQYLSKIRSMMPDVDEFMPIEEVGFDIMPHQSNAESAWVPISNGCNNFCTFCVVPFTRGREISRPFESIMTECKTLIKNGTKKVTLLGQNVNSYGADLLLGKENVQVMRDLPKKYFGENGKSEDTLFRKTLGGAQATSTPTRIEKNGYQAFSKPVYVKHLGKYRIPTLFPHLLDSVAKLGFEKVDFFSSNPWDFTDKLIKVIAHNPNISRTIHLPVQSGDDVVLERMNRWYTSKEYLNLVLNLKLKIKKLKLTTDIIVGFCGETDDEFGNTLALCKQVMFEKAYISIYSVRPMTAATKILADDVPHSIKKMRWEVLENIINIPNLKRNSS